MTERNKNARIIQTRLSAWDRFLENSGDWYQEKIELQERLEGQNILQPFKLTQATANQEAAIRSYARQEGFNNLRGFSTWLRNNDKTYYDVLKEAYRDA